MFVVTTTTQQNQYYFSTKGQAQLANSGPDERRQLLYTRTQKCKFFLAFLNTKVFGCIGYLSRLQLCHLAHHVSPPNTIQLKGEATFPTAEQPCCMHAQNERTTTPRRLNTSATMDARVENQPSSSHSSRNSGTLSYDCEGTGARVPYFEVPKHCGRHRHHNFGMLTVPTIEGTT